MASRLLVVAHGATTATQGGLRFPTADDRVATAIAESFGRPWVSAQAGPGRAMAETATMLGLPAVVDAAWADQDFGAWAGTSLDELAANDPVALQQWLGDPDFAPTGGESLTALVTRIGRALAGTHPDGLTVVVSSPAVVRACVVAALGAPPSACHRLDVAPLDAAEVNVNAGRVALRRLRPYPQWLTGRRPATDTGATRRSPRPPEPSPR